MSEERKGYCFYMNRERERQERELGERDREERKDGKKIKREVAWKGG